jgi:hypothetical protein
VGAADESIKYEIPVRRGTATRQPFGQSILTRSLTTCCTTSSDQPAKDAGLLVSPRRYAIGDIVNLPEPPDDRPRGGKGYIWRVTAVDDEPPTLWVEFIRPHPHMVNA